MGIKHWLGPAALFLLVTLGAPLLAAGEIAPNENLFVDGIPPLPASLAEAVSRYTEFRTATLTSWHPSRREILILTRFADTNQVHRVQMPGGARSQLTFYPDRVQAASYPPRPRGNYFVFSKDTGGNEFSQNYRYDLDTGRVTLLTDGRSRNSPGVWSTAGDRVAYTSTRRNGKDTDLYIEDPREPRSDRKLTDLEGGGWQPLDWSPDDRRLLALEEISINESYLWLFDAASGERTLLTPRGLPEKIAYGDARFSGDGRGLYLTSDRGSEFLQLQYLDLNTRRYRSLSAAIPWDVESFELSQDGRHLAFVTNEAGISRLHLLDTATGRTRAVPKLPVGLIANLDWRANNQELAFNLSTARSPADVYSWNIATDRIERWTTSELGGLNPASLAEPQLVNWPSFDKRTISGFLYRPPAKFTGRRPVIINIHGGPESQYRPGFLGRNNYLIDELGVAIVFPNVRGSSGYGKTFVQLDNGFKREDSVKDIGALLDWIATQPDLDPERVMVTGGSYGGYMTLAVATRYNDRIRCSLDVVGISNFVSFLERTESYRRDLRRVEYGDERDPKMREFLLAISPANNAARITRPLFVVQGKNDPRVPLKESEQMVETVKQGGSPVWYLMATDEGHGFAKKKNADFQFYSTVAFIQRYLLNQ
ncbi:peptidase S9 prolyl oligopeptidase active site domain protein [Gloeobacter kilaueensis JS1]|uniref:Peptidase S9 prolyl oligopeptidase active site domain protein n=1 Tax=Gloeobacter kilaueensis (strain ATCC BAA-2537 / CCAP 1431/1 / ULC 316 / JS1) TaxID=1183438 RepID=U5QJF4_GLOK1|nr:S9 family peptidase [Gloeobacter kilaueensis]AGY59046.1 peptidase S9 prolyl oligopeptidase active site domain protein [Gloeobacter kilaueensis JS1]